MGEQVPALSLPDQNGQIQTLESIELRLPQCLGGLYAKPAPSRIRAGEQADAPNDVLWSKGLLP